jgi:glycosyltransferase involved in cell wall biosynthesis
MPQVSVVIASYNYAHFLPQALDSVLAQTLQDWECIVVDDCSTDNTAEVVAAYSARDPRFRYIRNEANKGEAGSRNVGNAAASGEFIAVLDADDWWHPEKLERQIEAMKRRPGAVLCFTDRVDVRGEEYQRHLVPEEWLVNLDLQLRKDDRIPHASAIYLRRAVEIVGGYPEHLPFGVDWDLWLKLLHRYGEQSLVYVREGYLYYRIHESNMTTVSPKVPRGLWCVIARALWRGAWFLRHPIGACQVVDEQLHRDILRFLSVGDRRRAFWRALASTLLFGPTRRWRWQSTARILHAGDVS